jgi:hypothetical protein
MSNPSLPSATELKNAINVLLAFQPIENQEELNKLIKENYQKDNNSPLYALEDFMRLAESLYRIGEANVQIIDEETTSHRVAFEYPEAQSCRVILRALFEYQTNIQESEKIAYNYIETIGEEKPEDLEDFNNCCTHE